MNKHAVAETGCKQPYSVLFVQLQATMNCNVPNLTRRTSDAAGFSQPPLPAMTSIESHGLLHIIDLQRYMLQQSPSV